MLIKEYAKCKASLLRKFNLEPVHNAEPHENGEYALLDLLRTLPERSRFNSIVDIGANVGDWTAAVVERFDGSSISKFYCSEPLPGFAQTLRARFSSRPDVSIVEMALSDRSREKMQMFQVGMGGRMYRDYRGSKVKKTMADRPVAAETAGIKTITPYMVDVSTGDEVFGNVAFRPYMIKIDCDGHDLHVLRGFGATIRERRPIVQFEYSDFWIGAGSRLKDACRFLGEAGYMTFKILPDRLARFRYNSLFETFGYQNILGVPGEFASFAGRTIAFRGNMSARNDA